MTLKIGFLINPIAGLGGKKAWKGTDEIAEAWNFFEEGEQYSFERVKNALSSISSTLPIEFYCCGNPMGEEILTIFPFKSKKVYSPSINRTTSEDTQNACQVFLEKKVDLIIFVGGDGTARDVASIISDKIPALGIPSGVKMFSGCFLYRPQDLGEILEEIHYEEISYSPEDVMDVNEVLFRENRIQASLYGQLIVPQKTGLIQGGKISSAVTSLETYESMSLELIEGLSIKEGLVVLGTGSTVYHVMKSMGVEKTLLGIDIFENGTMAHRDIDEKSLFELTKNKDIKIILTPIGGQGFLLGRGNQQISSRVLLNSKSFKFIILSSEEKLDTIDRLELDLDDTIVIPDIKNGFIKVLTAYHQYSMKKIKIRSQD